MDTVTVVDNLPAAATPQELQEPEKPKSRSEYQQNWIAGRRKYGKCQCKAPLHVDAQTGRIYNKCKRCLKKDRDRKRNDTGSRPRRGNGRGRPRAV